MSHAIKNANQRENLITTDTKDPKEINVTQSELIPEIGEAADILQGKKEGELPGP